MKKPLCFIVCLGLLKRKHLSLSLTRFFSMQIVMVSIEHLDFQKLCQSVRVVIMELIKRFFFGLENFLFIDPLGQQVKRLSQF